MTPKQARRILREMNRRDRRDTFRMVYKFKVDGGRSHFVIDRHGIPRELIFPDAAAESGYLTIDDVLHGQA